MKNKGIEEVCSPICSLRFPSPCGEMVMKNMGCYNPRTKTVTFPSPCGEMVMKNMVRKRVKRRGALFPSPCGEMVMKNPINFDPDLYTPEYLFPSPCGEMVMKNQFTTVRRQNSPKFPKIVSVPLRGNGYEKPIGDFPSEPEIVLFPSPCGEMVMKNAYINYGGKLLLKMFPSPCGEMVMKNISSCTPNVSTLGGSFRPLAGKWL